MTKEISVEAIRNADESQLILRGEVIGYWAGAAAECGMIIVDLHQSDLAAARSEPEYLFRFRRPELYGSLSGKC